MRSAAVCVGGRPVLDFVCAADEFQNDLPHDFLPFRLLRFGLTERLSPCHVPIRQSFTDDQSRSFERHHRPHIAIPSRFRPLCSSRKTGPRHGAKPNALVILTLDEVLNRGVGSGTSSTLGPMTNRGGIRAFNQTVLDRWRRPARRWKLKHTRNDRSDSPLPCLAQGVNDAVATTIWRECL